MILLDPKSEKIRSDRIRFRIGFGSDLHISIWKIETRQYTIKLLVFFSDNAAIHHTQKAIDACDRGNVNFLACLFARFYAL